MVKIKRFFITAIITSLPLCAFAENGAQKAVSEMTAKSSASLSSEFIAAQNLMIQGRYQEAHDLAEALSTAEGYALASEALARAVMLGEFEKLKKVSKKARKQAEKALELDPNFQNARLQYVITDGFVARLTGDVSAWMKKLPQKSLVTIEAYRSDFPEDGRGDALLGAWHLAIIRRAGAKNAQEWFGANVEEGQRLYSRAVILAPNDPVILLNYALSLAALEENDFKDRAKIFSLLQHCSLLTPTDDLGIKLKAHAEKALSIIEKDGELKRYAERYLDGKLIQ